MKINSNYLFFLIAIPIVGVFCLMNISSKKPNLIKQIALNTSCLTFLYSLFLYMVFDNSVGVFQYVVKFNWLNNLNLNLVLGIDGISLFFIILTAFLTPLCLLVSWDSITTNSKEYYILFLIMELFLLIVFCVLDLLLFYIFFECVLIPMFIIIGNWGSRERKVRAGYFFFLYTLVGSVIMLLSVLYIYYQVGTTDYEVLLSFSFSNFEQKIMWFTFFLSFASKVPMVPVHLWLPEAHVEAPTAGSVILAGVLLKLGTYGFVRFSLPLFPQASFFFVPFVYSLAIIAILYTSLTAIRQTDFKRIIAYTSIAHMNFVLLGIFSFNNIGIEGAIIQSISHGFVASALFLIIGVVYERYHTRIVKYYGGLVHTMPLYTFIFMFFTMANIGLPGTSSFVGEFLILAGSYKVNIVATFFGAISMILGGCYSLWLFNRVSYGNLKIQYITSFSDLNKREFLTFFPLILGTLVLGIYPKVFLDPIHMSVNTLIELIYF